MKAEGGSFVQVRRPSRRERVAKVGKLVTRIATGHPHVTKNHRDAISAEEAEGKGTTAGLRRTSLAELGVSFRLVCALLSVCLPA